MPLLEETEPRAQAVVNENGTSPFFLTCDHASARIPRSLGDLGVSAENRQRHIAWDIGAAGVARELSRLLDATLVLQNYSRLVIDCNRPFENPASIPIESEGVEIPGNRDVTEGDRFARQSEIFDPYHREIRECLDRRERVGKPTTFVAIHSFTPVYHGVPRPWDVSVLYHRERRLSRFVLDKLGADPELCVGDNQPYQVTDTSDFGIPVHAERRGLACALIEFRQDLVEAPDGQRAWAHRLAACLGASPEFESLPPAG